MRTSQNGINFLKAHEGVRYKAYRLKGEQYFTIGVGHTYDLSITANTVWTDAQVNAALQVDLMKYEKYVEQYVKYPLNQNQFDALVSYTFNRGKGGIIELAKNSSSLQEYPDNIVKYWGTATRYKDALIKRRKDERELFIKGSANRPLITRGCTGQSVRELQKLLGIAETGYAGTETEIAIKAFQEQHGLVVDGKCGQKTWAELLK